MSIDTSIFKAYDIRGLVPDQLNPELIEKIGRAFVRLLQAENPRKKLNIVIGHDMRLSSESLKTSLVKGVIRAGANVIDIGLASTPTFYFAVGFYGYDGGLQVSASHNPKDYNGLKLVRAKAVPVAGDSGIKQIRDWVVENKFVDAPIPGKISSLKNVAQQAYKEEIKAAKIDPKAIKPFKIVVDPANAMGVIDLDFMFQDTPVKLIKLNDTLDGSFPSHQADPLKPENLEQLQRAVIKERADLGIAVDGDADRYFLVDEKGQPLRQEILRGIMAQLTLKDCPHAIICYDIRPGKITKDMIEEAGGIPSVTPVGHSLIKEQMIREGAPFGGESSGHYFYAFDFGVFEMPVVLILKFLLWLSKQNKPFSQAIKPYQKYFNSGEINSIVKDAPAIIKKLAKKYADADISYLDGITITYPDFWFNVRPSNTEPKLRLNLEAISPEIMRAKRDEVLSIIRQKN